MDMVRFTCSGCGKRIKAEVRFAGRQGRCRACRVQFTVPAMSDEESAAGDEARPFEV